jgi:hypothetical protein
MSGSNSAMRMGQAFGRAANRDRGQNARRANDLCDISSL